MYVYLSFCLHFWLLVPLSGFLFAGADLFEGGGEASGSVSLLSGSKDAWSNPQALPDGALTDRKSTDGSYSGPCEVNSSRLESGSCFASSSAGTAAAVVGHLKEYRRLRRVKGRLFGHAPTPIPPIEGRGVCRAPLRVKRSLGSKRGSHSPPRLENAPCQKDGPFSTAERGRSKFLPEMCPNNAMFGARRREGHMVARSCL